MTDSKALACAPWPRDLLAAWDTLVGRVGILPIRGDLAGLATAVSLLPSTDYRAAHERLRDRLHGWDKSAGASPPSYFVNAAKGERYAGWSTTNDRTRPIMFLT